MKKKKDDFDRQMQSLQERKANEWKKPSKNKTGSSKTTTLLRFTKAVFAVDDKDKPTERLMEETAKRVGALDGIGQQQGFQPRNLQIMAQQQQWATNNNNKDSFLETDNPYAALGGDDSDDDDNELLPPQQQQQQQQTLFNFAPPSFSFGGADEVDPDL